MDNQKTFESALQQADTERWLLHLAEETAALTSFQAFLSRLLEFAKLRAVQHDTSEVEWRSCQVYYKLVLDFQIFVQNTINRQKKEE